MRIFAVGTVAAVVGFFIGQHASPAADIISGMPVSLSGTTSGGYAPEVTRPFACQKACAANAGGYPLSHGAA
jgi:hypothetical protein